MLAKGQSSKSLSELFECSVAYCVRAINSQCLHSFYKCEGLCMYANRFCSWRCFHDMHTFEKFFVSERFWTHF